MIPKIIHYCWFGKNQLTELGQKCIESWINFFPGYEIKEWNESNYDVYKTAYTKKAYKAKKYAFVSDYARFDILYDQGGIYFDTDVEVIKPYDDVINHGSFMGMEEGGKVATGLGSGCRAGHPIAAEIINYYKHQHFSDVTTVTIVSEILSKYGLTTQNVIQDICGIRIYPTEYFCPKNFESGTLAITENTHSIHHYSSSWYSEEENRLKHEKWDFHQKYGHDSYLSNMYDNLKYHEKRYEKFDIENITLRRAYGLIAKRTVKKILGQDLVDRFKRLKERRKNAGHEPG